MRPDPVCQNTLAYEDAAITCLDMDPKVEAETVAIVRAEGNDTTFI